MTRKFSHQMFFVGYLFIIYLFIYLFVYLFIYLFFFLFFYFFIYLFIYLLVFPSALFSLISRKKHIKQPYFKITIISV